MYKPEKIDILDYINNLRTNRGTLSKKEEEGVRKTFRSGYCYMFANLLKTAYPGGQIMLAFPHSHVVYQFRGNVYDIEGEIDMSKVDHILIPVTKGIFGLDLYNKFRYGFMHVEDPEEPISISEMMTIYINYFYDVDACVGLINDLYRRILTLCDHDGYRKEVGIKGGNIIPDPNGFYMHPGLMETMDRVSECMDEVIKGHMNFLKSFSIVNEVEEFVIYELYRAYRDRWEFMMNHYILADDRSDKRRVVRDIYIYLVKKADKSLKQVQMLMDICRRKKDLDDYGNDEEVRRWASEPLSEKDKEHLRKINEEFAKHPLDEISKAAVRTVMGKTYEDEGE